MKGRKFLVLTLTIILTGSPLVFSGCFKEEEKLPYRFPLEVWGVYDDSDAFNEINQLYKAYNPKVSEVDYRKISADNEREFEQELVDALANGKGPDIILFKNSWLPKHQSKLAPLPSSEAQLANFKQNFADVARQDFVWENQIYAMPLYCDTLALYYNREILNQEGIVYPPSTWEEVKREAEKLSKIDENGDIRQSAIALGRSSNPPAGVNRASDILMLLMMQAGARMNSEGGRLVNFETSEFSGSNPGADALSFYTQFSQGGSDFYSWNSRMDYSIDSFAYGRTAMMMGYSYMADTLKKKNPKLRFEIASAPQIDLEDKVNLASYWGMAVLKNKTIKPSPQTGNYTNEDRVKEAWNYIQFVTQKPRVQGLPFDPTEKYLEMTEKPTARRDLIEKQKKDEDLRIFAEQVLTARSWKRPDDVAVDKIFDEMINEVVIGKKTVGEAISSATIRINSLYAKKSYEKSY